jgi:hypothetical protein
VQLVFQIDDTFSFDFIILKISTFHNNCLKINALIMPNFG